MLQYMLIFDIIKKENKMNIDEKIALFVEKNVPKYELEEYYIKLYKEMNNINKDISILCSYLHGILNFYVDSYNNRIGSHFCAGDSRDYLKVIRLLKEFNYLIKNSKYKLTLDENYNDVLTYAENSLTPKYGSEIPHNAPYLYRKDYDPIFTLELINIHPNAKYLIFGTNVKPEIIISNILDADIQIVKNADKCLIYDIPLNNTLTKDDLLKWWGTKKYNINLYDRLCEPLSDIEKKFFTYYWENAKNSSPALIPQVYLHYDPKTIKELVHIQNGEKRLTFQRMDFLMLVNGNRIIIEIDGVQHYATDDKPDKKKYANQVKYDRDMKFLNYDIYRIGGYELTDDNFDKTVLEFFTSIKNKYFNK